MVLNNCDEISKGNPKLSNKTDVKNEKLALCEIHQKTILKGFVQPTQWPTTVLLYRIETSFADYIYRVSDQAVI